MLWLWLIRHLRHPSRLPNQSLVRRMNRNLTARILILLLCILCLARVIAFQPIPHRKFCTRVTVTVTQTGALLAKKKVQEEQANHDKWLSSFERLAKYKDTHGTVDITNDEELKKWLDEQREQYQWMLEGKKVRLTRKRATALERLGAVTESF